MQSIKTQRNDKISDVKTQKKEKSWVKFIVGLIIGFTNGIFGGGGGMICVPILEKILKMPPKNAHASTIAIIFPISFVSAIIYILNGELQTPPLLTVLIGGILGGLVGALLLKLLPEKLVSILFAFLMIFMGVRLII